MDRIEDKENNGVFVRTVIRKDVHERLKEYALNLQTGLGHWDFGVAIERLLDTQFTLERLSVLEERVNQLELQLLEKDLKEENPVLEVSDDGLLRPKRK